MGKVRAFLALLVAALAALVVSAVVGFTVFTAPTGSSPTGWNWMSNMGNMMGGTTGNQAAAQNPAWPYLGIGFIVLIGVAIAGVGGMAYYIAFPQIKMDALVASPVAAPETVETVLATTPKKAVEGAYDSVAKT